MTYRYLWVCLVLAFFWLNLAQGYELPDDPFLLVTRETLPNGMKVVFAPNDKAKTFRMKIRVGAGFDSETEETAGISHLLEHYLFTDARLKDDMSYVEMIREKGGSANGQTSEMETVYFATVPTVQTKWLSDLFYSMLFKRTFEPERLEQVKKPVLLEIGKPEPMAWLMDSFVIKLLSPKILKTPDFWKSEFGIEHEHFSHAHESLNTLRLNARELETYYREYYHPGNITIFCAGKFDPVEMRKLLSGSFGTVADWPGKSLVESAPEPRNSRYVRSSSTSGTPYITLGTKVWGMSPEDEVALRVYLEYLAHRLTKEIRNKHGDTYTVRPVVSLKENFGDGYITMESPGERYRQYLDYIRGLIHSEAREGALTEAQFNEAMELYLTHFKLSDRDSGTQLSLAESFDRWSKVYGRNMSQFDAFRNLKYPEFRERLMRLFQRDHDVSVLSEPPLLFRLESFLLNLGSLIFFLAIARRVFSSPFEHDRVRWIRKLSHPPAYLVETLFLGFGLALSGYAWQAFHLLELKSNWIQSSFVLSNYAGSFISWGLAIFSSILCCSALLRKMIVSGDRLYLKSMTYMSTRIPLSEIESVSAVRPFQVFASPNLLWAIKWRCQFWNPCFWQKGTLIRLKNGKAYFVGIRKSELAAKELAELLPGDSVISYPTAA